MEHRWNEIDRGKPKYWGGKPVPVPFCPPQIPHGLTWDRTRVSAVRVKENYLYPNINLSLFVRRF
jgi:hypothetical protein